MDVVGKDTLITGAAEHQVVHHLRGNSHAYQMWIYSLKSEIFLDFFSPEDFFHVGGLIKSYFIFLLLPLVPAVQVTPTFMHSTVLVCPSSVRSSSPLLASLTLMVLSKEPTSRIQRAPSCDEARQLTARGPWHSNTSICLLVCTSEYKCQFRLLGKDCQLHAFFFLTSRVSRQHNL